MGDYRAIQGVEETLKELLERDEFWTGITPKPLIVFGPPTEINDTENKISFFLYQIVENIYLKNEVPQRIDNTRLQQHPPLSLDLMYMITPFGPEKTVILGRIMQILLDNAVLYGTDLKKGLEGLDEEIKILFNPISLDDLTKIWSAFKEASYRLSVSYIVTPVRIESTISMDMTRVVSKEMGIYIPKGE